MEEVSQLLGEEKRDGTFRVSTLGGDNDDVMMITMMMLVIMMIMMIMICFNMML